MRLAMMNWPTRANFVGSIRFNVGSLHVFLLEGTCPDEFTQSIAKWVLAEQDAELRSLLQWSWIKSRKYVAAK